MIKRIFYATLEYPVMAYNKSYVYDKGQFVMVARNLGGRSVGITGPDAVRREMGIRPGVKLMVKLRVIKEDTEPEVDF